jgi:DNA-binding XRE family transcriptional regulator
VRHGHPVTTHDNQAQEEINKKSGNRQTPACGSWCGLAADISWAYIGCMWEISLHPEVEAWFLGLCRSDSTSADLVAEAIDLLAAEGPALGRPLVDRLKGSMYHNMKELRPGSAGTSEIRMIFAFDPQRRLSFWWRETRRGSGRTGTASLFRWPTPLHRASDRVEGRAGMSTNWRDVKAKARAADPEWDSAQRVERRAQMRREMLAAVSGAQLAEIRKQLGLTQTQLAEAAGLSQARISQIESGTVTSLETLRAYVAGLGGHLDVVARIGNIQLNVA